MNILRFTRAWFNLLSQTPYMYVHRPHITSGSRFIPPYKAQQFFSAVNFIGVADKKLQKVKCLCRQVNLFFCNKDASAVRIQL